MLETLWRVCRRRLPPVCAPFSGRLLKDFIANVKEQKKSLLHPSPRKHSKNNCFHPQEFSFAPLSALHFTPTSAPVPAQLLQNLLIPWLHNPVLYYCDPHFARSALCSVLPHITCILGQGAGLGMPSSGETSSTPAAQLGQALCLWVSCAP